VSVEVIAVHRMLKNDVPAPEYILMSEPVYAHAEPLIRDHAHEIVQELEGLGPARLYFVDLDHIGAELPPPPDVTWPRAFARRQA
jgi:hypothetical protein